MARHSTERTDRRGLLARRTSRRVLLALTVVFLCAPSALNSTHTAEAAASRQVLVLGDSLVGGSSNYIDFYMSQGGKVRTTVKAIGGSAICDLLAGNGGPWTLDHLLTATRYSAVVMAYSGSGLTKCTKYLRGQALVDNYKAAATAVMKISSRHGVRNVVWVKPPAAAAAEPKFIRSQLGAFYATLPASWTNARVIDGGKNITPGGTFQRSLPCGAWEKTAAQGCVKNSIRVGADDGAHFYCTKRPTLPYGLVAPCATYSSGGNRYGMNLAATRAFIGL